MLHYSTDPTSQNSNASRQVLLINTRWCDTHCCAYGLVSMNLVSGTHAEFPFSLGPRLSLRVNVASRLQRLRKALTKLSDPFDQGHERPGHPRS